MPGFAYIVLLYILNVSSLGKLRSRSTTHSVHDQSKCRKGDHEGRLVALERVAFLQVGSMTTRVNTSHLRTSHGKLQSERIKQVDKIEKLLLRIKRRRWRQLALLGFVFVVNLLDLPAVNAQATWRQDVLGHLLP